MNKFPIADIIPLIPQRAPFVMIDALESCDDVGATTSFSIRQENIFVEDNLLKEPALVENMAQTAAARMGYICQQENKPVPVGFIGAVQQLQILALPAVGETLHTTIHIKNQIFNATIIEAAVMVNDKRIATCDMKIFMSSP